MHVTKKVISNLNKCYAMSEVTVEGKRCFVVAAEKHDPCYLFSEEGELLEKVWGEPGGVMTMAPVPGADGQFLAIQVGRKAMAVSRGEREPGVGFFILSSILLLMDMAELIMGALSIAGIIPSDEDITDQISTLLVDFTSVVMLIEMIVAAVMIRKLTKAISDRQNTAQHSSGAA